MVIIDKRLTSVESQLTDLSEKVESVIGTQLNDLSKKVDTLLSEDSPGRQVSKKFSAKPEIISEITNEIKERERRALNVVFAGEMVTKEKVEKFVGQAGVDSTGIKKIETEGKKCLFIVTLNTEPQKWSLIKKARQISRSVEGLENIFVNPDLTKTERDIQYQLRQELRRRRALGETVKISKGRVVEMKE